MSNKNTSEIKVLIQLDENRVPEKLSWSAVEGGVNLEEAKAFMIYVWNSDEKATKCIQLWTKDMPVDHMKIFFHQTLLALTETFQRATGDENMTARLKDFCDYFEDKLKLKG